MTTLEIQEMLEAMRTRADIRGKSIATFCPIPRQAPQGEIVPGAGNSVFKGTVTDDEGPLALLPRRLWSAVVTGAAGISRGVLPAGNKFFQKTLNLFSGTGPSRPVLGQH